MKRFLLVSLALFLAGCSSLSPATPPPVPPTPTSSPSPVDMLYTGTEGYPWWNDAVFYEIFVRSFNDSNGDGIGDFNGITQKLDYLNDGDPNTTTDLGVTAIWLMPIFPSPSYHGYDVIDYYSVNPQYGTMEDFQKLINEAHKRGIRVIIDMVFNHTSDKNEWFESAKADTASQYRDWYIWSETDPGYKGPWGEEVWHPSLTGYYYGIFEAFMPDLNYTNPEVTDEMGRVTDFWLGDIGVDGFRLDAAKHLIENGRQQANTEATHEWFEGYRPVYKASNPNAMTVGEFFGDNLATIKKYTEGDELDSAFNFDLASAYVESARTNSALPALGAINMADKVLTEFQYAPFLTNHDQNRVMSVLQGDMQKSKVAASLLLTSPGTPFIYYGEEIGMMGTKPDENIRRPMQWDTTKGTAGFTTGKPWRQPDSSYLTNNVSAETGDNASLLSHYRSLIAIRNLHPALRIGTYELVRGENGQIFSNLRQSKDETLLVLINLSDQPVQDYELSIQSSGMAEGTYTIVPLLGEGDFGSIQVGANGKFSGYKPLAELPPYSTYILKLEK